MATFAKQEVVLFPFPYTDLIFTANKFLIKRNICEINKNIYEQVVEKIIKLIS
ncbi:MAG: hypothetical protein ABIC91_00130 [Nanoarchaeota archaeon]|nr:hypothetical protein [Nanoarchaeota archaeon]MBU1029620.1 hypothetical protein [Nanoarchaeota archaeon]MBU1850227.1 hypothetical protein [Nanoarchaeota archaeon]